MNTTAPAKDVQWVVATFSWNDRDDITPGWEPFAWDSERAEIVCRKRVETINAG